MMSSAGYVPGSLRRCALTWARQGRPAYRGGRRCSLQTRREHLRAVGRCKEDGGRVIAEIIRVKRTLILGTETLGAVVLRAGMVWRPQPTCGAHRRQAVNRAEYRHFQSSHPTKPGASRSSTACSPAFEQPVTAARGCLRGGRAGQIGVWVARGLGPAGIQRPVASREIHIPRLTHRLVPRQRTRSPGSSPSASEGKQRNPRRQRLIDTGSVATRVDPPASGVESVDPTLGRGVQRSRPVSGR